jgi:WD40 repeat protein
MSMTSSSVAPELVSVSTDGLLCHWDVTRLTEPISVVQLHLPSASALTSSPLDLLSPTRGGGDATSLFASLLGGAGGGGSGANNQQNPLNICAVAFAHTVSGTGAPGAGSGTGAGRSGAAAAAAAAAAGANTGAAAGVGDDKDIIFGCGSGVLVRSPLPYKDGHPGAVKIDAHCGLITAVEPHPSSSQNHKHLLLSSSLDWTVRLWDLKNFSTPLLEFSTPSYDYVCDVQWSPVHPAMFVTATSGGRLALWNLSRSTTEPVDAVSVVGADVADVSAGGVSAAAASSGAASAGGAGAGAGAAGLQLRALNKVVWAKDGQSLLCGDSRGTLHMVKLHAAAVAVSPSDEGRFESAVTSRRANAAGGAAASAYEVTSTEEGKFSELVPSAGAGAGAEAEADGIEAAVQNMELA